MDGYDQFWSAVDGSMGAVMPVFVFNRYINGQLMAEGVRIERQPDLESAMREAARIAAYGPKGEIPVLALIDAQVPAGEPVMWQSRARQCMEGDCTEWSKWRSGKAPQPVPFYFEVEERALYAFPAQAPAVTANREQYAKNANCSAQPAPPAAPVKPLEWVEHPDGTHESSIASHGGLYIATNAGWRSMSGPWNRAASMEEAKAAAEAAAQGGGV